MAENIDTRVPAGLHPDNIKSIEGYEANASVLAPTERAFAEAYSAIGTVFEAREAARNDPTLNEAAQILKTDDLARKVQTKLTREFDSVRENLEKGIAHIDAELSRPVTASAAHPVASEIRRHVANLSSGERIAFIRSAIENGDDTTSTAVLGAPAYLSGMDADMKQTFTRMYRERTSPDMAARLKVMAAAKELLENRGGSILTTLERAVGCIEVKRKDGFVEKRIYPQELRNQKAHSDRAFAPQAA